MRKSKIVAIPRIGLFGFEFQIAPDGYWHHFDKSGNKIRDWFSVSEVTDQFREENKATVVLIGPYLFLVAVHWSKRPFWSKS